MAACSSARKSLGSAERELARAARVLRSMQTGSHRVPQSLLAKAGAASAAVEAARSALNAGSCTRAATLTRKVRSAVNAIYTHTGA